MADTRSSHEGIRDRFADLSDDEIERLSAESVRYARLTRRAEGVLGDRDLALEWLHMPNRGLAGATPLAHALTEGGAREVEALLGRLAHGVVV